MCFWFHFLFFPLDATMLSAKATGGSCIIDEPLDSAVVKPRYAGSVFSLTHKYKGLLYRRR